MTPPWRWTSAEQDPQRQSRRVAVPPLAFLRTVQAASYRRGPLAPLAVFDACRLTPKLGAANTGRGDDYKQFRMHRVVRFEPWEQRPAREKRAVGVPSDKSSRRNIRRSTRRARVTTT